MSAPHVFSDNEIQKARELKRLGFPRSKFKPDAPTWSPERGHYVFARHCPSGCLPVHDQVHLVVEPTPQLTDEVWLPTLDDLLRVARHHHVTFSQVTDFIHRKRFADHNEREGLYQLFIELLR